MVSLLLCFLALGCAEAARVESHHQDLAAKARQQSTLRRLAFNFTQLQTLQDGMDLPLTVPEMSLAELGEKLSQAAGHFPSQWAKRLKVVKILGEGGFGRVFLCSTTCSDPSTSVSVKLIQGDSAAAQHEVDIMRRMYGVSEYCVSTIGAPDYVRTSLGMWLMMPYYNSGDLFSLVKRCQDNTACKCGGCEASTDRSCQCGKELSWDKLGSHFSRGFVLALFYQAVEGVAALHSQGFVHRDLKLENIMVNCKEEGVCYASIIDLGLACHEGLCKGASGTPGYMAPEAWASDASGLLASDVFSLGVVLYRLLYRQPPPFQSDRIGIQTKLYQPSEDPNFQGKRGELDDLVMAMMVPNHERRISTNGVLRELRQAIETEAPPKVVVSMLLHSPTRRGAKDALPRCLFQQAHGDAKDIGDKPFHRLDCADLPKRAPFKCGFCVLCNPCCMCQANRHDKLVPEFFRMESCK